MVIDEVIMEHDFHLTQYISRGVDEMMKTSSLLFLLTSLLLPLKYTASRPVTTQFQHGNERNLHLQYLLTQIKPTFKLRNTLAQLSSQSF